MKHDTYQINVIKMHFIVYVLVVGLDLYYRVRSSESEKTERLRIQCSY